MLERKKIATIVAMLPDKRVLLYKRGRLPWEITREYYVKRGEKVLDAVNTALWRDFGIDPNSYSDSYAEISQKGPIQCSRHSIIYPIMLQFKGIAAWEAEKGDFYTAMNWSDLHEDIMANSIYQSGGTNAKHTSTAIEIAKFIQQRGFVG